MPSPSPPALSAAFASVRAHPLTVSRAVHKGLSDKRVMTHASAISYQLLFALAALSLAGLAILSVLGLGDNFWQDGIRPVVREHLPGDVFRLVDGTVREIEGPKEHLWLTVGLAIAVWKLSAAARVTGDALDEIYEVLTTNRVKGLRRLRRSLLLGVGAGACLLAAAAIVIVGGVTLGHLLPGALSFAIRWGAALVLMLAAAALILRYGPSERQPADWVSVGTVLVVVAWGLTSIAFGIYAAYLANWKTLFGGFTVAIAILLYLYVSSVAFLVGAQLDLDVRKAVAAATGRRRESPRPAPADGHKLSSADGPKGREEAPGRARGGRRAQPGAAPDHARAT
jgi:membrane protein